MYNILQSKFQLKSANINFLKWKFGDANAFEKISLLWYLLFNQIGTRLKVLYFSLLSARSVFYCQF